MPTVATPLASFPLMSSMRIPRVANIQCSHGIKVSDYGVSIYTSTGGKCCKATVFYRCIADLLVTHLVKQCSERHLS